jgi:hypothetical protein
MRLSYRLPFVGVFLLAAASISLRAQENVLYPSLPSPIRYGVELGGNYNMFSQDFQRELELEDSPFNAWAEGTGISWYVTAMAEYVINKTMGIQAKLGIDQKRVGNSFDGIADGAVARPGGSLDYQSGPMTLETSLRATYLTLGAHFRLDLTPGLFATVGPTFHLRIDSLHQTEKATYTGEGELQFSDQAGNSIGKTLETEMNLSSDQSTRIGIEAAVGYRFEVGPSLVVAPTLRYQYMISPFIEDRPSGDQYRRFTYRDEFPNGFIPVSITNSTLTSIQLGIGLQFGH